MVDIDKEVQQIVLSDGRKDVKDLFFEYDKLLKAGWIRQTVYKQTVDVDGKIETLPINAYIYDPIKNGKPKPSFWIIGGVHGEEPAGPNAFAESIDILVDLSQKGIPLVFIPLQNPEGYINDSRYFDSNQTTDGHSVTDSDHVLCDLEDKDKPRVNKPNNKYAEENLRWVTKKVKDFPPLLIMDHHEDLVENDKRIDSRGVYNYIHCKDIGKLEVVCKLITKTLKDAGHPVIEEGRTRWNEVVNNGFVLNTHDGSIDEFLTATEFFDYYDTKTVVSKPTQDTVGFVIETTRDDTKELFSLSKRIDIHKAIIREYGEIWDLVKANYDKIR